MKDKKPAAKATKAEIEQRVRTVQHMILNETHPGDLTNAIMREYGVCERMAQNYIAQAREEIKEAGTRFREDEVAKAIMFHGRQISWAMSVVDDFDKRTTEAVSKSNIMEADSLRRRSLQYRNFASGERDKINRILGIGGAKLIELPQANDVDGDTTIIISSGKVINTLDDIAKLKKEEKEPGS